MSQFKHGDRVRYTAEQVKKTPHVRDMVGDVVEVELFGTCGIAFVTVQWEDGRIGEEIGRTLEREWDV
jgi:hypothetical protein